MDKNAKIDGWVEKMKDRNEKKSKRSQETEKKKNK